MNDDPLNIVLGNPQLRPSFTNQFSVSYSSFKIFDEQYFSIHTNFSNIHRPIVSNSFTDAVGRNIFRCDNPSDKSPNAYSVYSSFSKKLKKLNLHIGIILSSNGNVYYNITNDELNRTISSSYNGSISLNCNIQRKYSIRVIVGPNSTHTESSLQRQQNNNG